MNSLRDVQTVSNSQPQKSVELESVLRIADDFLSLTKPRIMILLLISTCCPMILASEGHLAFAPFLWALLGGALCSGSASVFNCIWDRDIDALMLRTQKRPLAQKRISVPTALSFGTALGIAGIAVWWTKFNFLSAALAAFGHFFYVVVYTMLLKRSTPQNIVIGGAAGAIPPLVGWAAVRGELDMTALLIFLVIFLWTPPHFWALALNKNEDYRRAGVPMLPVVCGERSTHLQMFLYSLALIPVTLFLVFQSNILGALSFIGLTGLGLLFSYKVWGLLRLGQQESPLRSAKAWDVFGFSLVYLALFFVFLVVDSTIL